MNINATHVGLFIVVLAVIMALVCFYLGKRKTQTPILTAIIGVLSAFMPPLALVYLIVLICKNDVQSNGSPIESADVSKHD